MSSRKKARGSVPDRMRRWLSGRVNVARSLLILLGGALLAGAALALAVSGVARQRVPAQALMMTPWEGAAIAADADIKVLSGKKMSAKFIEQRMQKALRSQPINPKAVRLLAFAADFRGDKKAAAVLVEKAATLSRRDMLTQLMLIELRAEQGKMAEVLSHYDAALRTNSTAGQVLFPRLSKAIRNPEIRAALKPYIDRDVDWADEFFNFALVSKQDLSALVDLTIESGGPRNVTQAKKFRTNLLNLLFDTQAYADMRRLYLDDTKASPDRLVDVEFSARDIGQRYGPMGWQLLDDAESGASFAEQPQQKRPGLAVYASAATTRTVARKVMFLAPGTYDFNFTTGAVESDEGGGLGWRWRCLSPLMAEPLAQAANVIRSRRTAIVIPATCQVQLVEIFASGGQGQRGLEGEVRDISLGS